MILLDTMVVAEPLREAPNTRVIAWLDSQVAESLFVAAVSLTYLQRAAMRLPASRRKEAMRAVVGVMALFEGRIVPFDMQTALAFGRMIETVRREGSTISQHNGLLAAIAMTGPFSIATGDTPAFNVAHLPLIDPWYF